MITRLGIGFMKAIAHWPLRRLRALGTLLGLLLFVLVVPRRKVAMRNLELCFPQWTNAQRQRAVRAHFIAFAQAWLDRAWLWHADPALVRSRIRLEGAVDALDGQVPTILFVPHFLGLDAAATGLSQQIVHRGFIGVYTRQSNPLIDEWVKQGRQRFGKSRPLHRSEGVREMIAAVREGDLMFLLPDMNFGLEDSIFVPFFGVQAATLPSLSRFARLCRARVVPVVALLTPEGYALRLYPPWEQFPSADIAADTARMNRELEGYIRGAPEQYYWVHKRFKSRPPGEPGVY
ncbi:MULTISPECIES: lysophospholipid acyltransferase family protein [Ramlibacter]|uniref:Lysophospholipid acyltransferase family protein n=1 Tax=Ramlibacter aquaticus TaxID=2780094 RepID=A0ABR9SHL0_9BURK|nr:MULTISPECIES: lysophospholipid acyltransferase family protein [Ramlibacter]MBE7941845.1 lysophospholipid acyltransferase family protein [Ramlibacter aquaticus]